MGGYGGSEGEGFWRWEVYLVYIRTAIVSFRLISLYHIVSCILFRLLSVV